MRRWHDRTERGNRVRVDEKQTRANEPLSTRRKNMAWDVLNRILEFARVRKLLNEDLLLRMKPFKDSGPAAELLKQLERVQLRSKFVFPNRSGGAPNLR